MKSKFTYAASGVDIDVEEQAAEIMYGAAKQTWENRKGKLGEVITPFDDFSGVRAIDVGNLPSGTLMNIGFEGTGTKSILAEQAGKYDSIAFDLFAMVCDDAVIRGAEPVIMGSILDINTLGEDESRLPIIRELAKGYVAAAKAAEVAVVNGEIAQLGPHVGGKVNEFAFSWGAGLVWFANKNRLLTGKEIEPGQAIIGLREPGLRSNGISLVRKVMTSFYGDNWISQKVDSTPLSELALTPSVIYSGAITEMTGGWDINKKPKASISGLAHITGSGIPGKLGRALKPSGLGAMIDDPFEPSQLMLHCQELGNVTDYEAYRTWNMGQGMAVITPQPEDVIKIAKKHNIEAAQIGRVTKEPGIKIQSRGFFKDKEGTITYT